MTNVDEWRLWLYPLGLVAQIAFGLRFLVQWIESEKMQQSVVPPLFWKFSLFGNGALFIHSFIQAHFPMCLVQSLNAVLFWRNLNLLKPLEKQYSIQRVLYTLLFAAVSTTSLFALQTSLVSTSWVSAPWSFADRPSVSPWIHFLGILGILCYSSRFWIQWLQAEQKKMSVLTPAFWRLSLCGALLSIFYFSILFDWINLLGAALSIIPYSRNLWLGRKTQPTSPSQSIFIFAGEVSADLYGKEIISHLQKKLPNFRLWGVGGPAMREGGFESILPMENFRVMGFSSVLKRLPRIIKNFFIIKRAIRTQQPQAVLFIDQPAFSMKLAKALRKAAFTGKIIQLVAPTVWAWKSHRAEAMSKDFDLLLTLFDFEPTYFSHTPLKTVFVGHPMVEVIEKDCQVDRLQEFGLDTCKPILTLFPGSRPSEIKRNLPKQLEAAHLLCTQYPEIQLALCTTEKIKLPDPQLHLVPFSDRYSLMKNSTLALAKSGTVTLELAIHAVPTVVTYELSRLNTLIAGYIYKINLPFYCIVNILTQKELFTELIRPPVSVETIVDHLKERYINETARSNCQQECRELKARLQTDVKPTMRAVEEICALLKKA